MWNLVNSAKISATVEKKKSEKRTLNDVKSPSWLCKRYCNCKFPQNIHTRSDTNRYRYPLYYTVHSAPEQHHIHVYHLPVCKYLNIILYIRLWLTKVFLMQRTVVPRRWCTVQPRSPLKTMNINVLRRSLEYFIRTSQANHLEYNYHRNVL